MDFIRIIIAILLPPLGVFLQVGFAGAFAGLNKPAATSTALVIVARSSSMFLSSAHGMFNAPDAAKMMASIAIPRSFLELHWRRFKPPVKRLEYLRPRPHGGGLWPTS